MIVSRGRGPITDMETVRRYNRPHQRVSSKGTSISQVPAVYGTGRGLEAVRREYIDGKDVIDLAAGGYFHRMVAPRYPNVTPRDPYYPELYDNDGALFDRVYDTAVLSNVLNVIEEEESIYDLLRLARTVADVTVVTIYQAKSRGDTSHGYQRAEPLSAYQRYCEDVFGRGNVRRVGNAIICQSR